MTTLPTTTMVHSSHAVGITTEKTFSSMNPLNLKKTEITAHSIETVSYQC